MLVPRIQFETPTPVGEEIDGVVPEHQVLHYRVDLLPRLHQGFSTCDAEVPVGFCLAPDPLDELVWGYLLPRVLPLRIYSKHSVTTTNNSPVRQLTVTPTRAPQIATSESHEGGGDSSIGSFALDARVDLTQPQYSPTSHSSLEARK